MGRRVAHPPPARAWPGRHRSSAGWRRDPPRHPACRRARRPVEQSPARPCPRTAATRHRLHPNRHRTRRRRRSSLFVARGPGAAQRHRRPPPNRRQTPRPRRRHPCHPAKGPRRCRWHRPVEPRPVDPRPVEPRPVEPRPVEPRRLHPSLRQTPRPRRRSGPLPATSPAAAYVRRARPPRPRASAPQPVARCAPASSAAARASCDRPRCSPQGRASTTPVRLRRRPRCE